MERPQPMHDSSMNHSARADSSVDVSTVWGPGGLPYKMLLCAWSCRVATCKIEVI